MEYGDGKPKPAGTWDYYGSCAPDRNGVGGYQGMQTFTLGVFQWVAMSRGKGTKRGKVFSRFIGDVADPAKCHDEACAWCEKQNEMEEL